MRTGAKIGAVIQARLGSSRLPRKVLRNLDGRPLLSRIVDQLRGSSKIESLCVSTSTSPGDDELAAQAAQWGLTVARGSVDDIIGRLWGAAEKLQCDYLVRVWGDCPFVCPDIIDRMIDVSMNKNYSYLTNGDIHLRNLPPGLDAEIYHRALLQELNIKVTEARLREFPVEYVKANLPAEKWSVYRENHDLPEMHLTVDYAEDLQAAEKIYELLQNSKQKFFTFTELKACLRAHPELIGMFSKAERNIEYKNYLATKN